MLQVPKFRSQTCAESCFREEDSIYFKPLYLNTSKHTSNIAKTKGSIGFFYYRCSVYFWKIKGLSSLLELTKVCDEEDAMVGDV